MTTAEIFTPFLLNGLFAMIGGIATVCAFTVKGADLHDADNAKSKFANVPNEKGRKNFLLLYSIPSFVIGGGWGLAWAGTFSATINEAIGYLMALLLGVVANSVVIKANDISPQAILKLIGKYVGK